VDFFAWALADENPTENDNCHVNKVYAVGAESVRHREYLHAVISTENVLKFSHFTGPAGDRLQDVQFQRERACVADVPAECEYRAEIKDFANVHASHVFT
jgi:hypothetical protein